tara:strand:+ start:313 stop:852 length:540 start_codon:yes stop_codon:yes gene_type:complete
MMRSNDAICWSPDYCLKWSDFQAESNPAIYEDSHSFLKYGFTWIVGSTTLNNDIVFSIDQIQLFTEFHPLLSWVRKFELNDSLLNHEQGHFDLCEIIKTNYYHILKNEFYGKVFPTRGQNDAQRKQFAKEDSGKLISTEINKLNNILKEKREEYDNETEYGKNILNQTKYNDIFQKFKL